MIDDPAGVVNIASLGEHAERFAAEMSEQLTRDRATAVALQEYLDRQVTTT